MGRSATSVVPASALLMAEQPWNGASQSVSRFPGLNRTELSHESLHLSGHESTPAKAHKLPPAFSATLPEMGDMVGGGTLMDIDSILDINTTFDFHNNLNCASRDLTSEYDQYLNNGTGAFLQNIQHENVGLSEEISTNMASDHCFNSFLGFDNPNVYTNPFYISPPSNPLNTGGYSVNEPSAASPRLQCGDPKPVSEADFRARASNILHPDNDAYRQTLYATIGRLLQMAFTV